MWTAFKRIIRAGFVGFWRNAFVSLASIFVMTVTLFVIASTMLLDQLLGASLDNIQEKVDIVVYFTPDAPQEGIEAFRGSLEALPDVVELTSTSRDEALKEFRERYKGDEVAIQALEELDENPLGASLAIRAKETYHYESIAQYISEQMAPGAPSANIIDKFDYTKNRDAIDRLTGIINAVEKASFITMLVLVAAAVLITFNTVRLAIYTSREEISVMRLVGASNTYIRGPFMLQGIMYGLVSGVLSLLIVYPMLLWIGPETESFFQFNLFNYFVTNFAYIFIVIVGIGVALGLVSSIMAVSRYLRV